MRSSSTSAQAGNPCYRYAMAERGRDRDPTNAGNDDDADDDAFAELLSVAAEVLPLVAASPDDGLEVELAGEGKPTLLVIVQGGPRPAVLCVPSEAPAELGVAEGDTVAAPGAFGVSFMPAEAVGMPAEMVQELRAAGWPADVFPAVQVNDDTGLEVKPDADDLRAVSTILMILLEAGLEEAVRTRQARRVVLEGGDVPLTVTWLADADDGVRDTLDS